MWRVALTIRLPANGRTTAIGMIAAFRHRLIQTIFRSDDCFPRFAALIRSRRPFASLATVASEAACG